MVQDGHVGADVEAFLAGDDAEGFGVQGAGAADSFFEDAGEEDFGCVLASGVGVSSGLGKMVEGRAMGERTGLLQRRERREVRARC